MLLGVDSAKRLVKIIQLAPVYEKLAQKMAALNPNVILARMDATENEVEGIKIEGYPTLIFISGSDRKQTPVDLKERTEETFVQFLKEHTTFPWNDVPLEPVVQKTQVAGEKVEEKVEESTQDSEKKIEL